MTFLDRTSESAELVSGMASRLDMDIGARIVASPETAVRSYAVLVRRCAKCSEHAACARLQQENSTLAEAPPYCLNRHVLHR